MNLINSQIQLLWPVFYRAIIYVWKNQNCIRKLCIQNNFNRSSGDGISICFLLIHFYNILSMVFSFNTCVYVNVFCIWICSNIKFETNRIFCFCHRVSNAFVVGSKVDGHHHWEAPMLDNIPISLMALVLDN